MSRLDDILSRNVYRLMLPSGKVPVDEWIESLAFSFQTRITARLRRVSSGNYGDFKYVGEGVFELRFDFGSGYRIYFGQKGSNIVLLICGGDKKSQNTDIRKAKYLWAQYQKGEIRVLEQ